MNPFLLCTVFLGAAALLIGAAALRDHQSRRALAGRLGGGLERNATQRNRGHSFFDQWAQRIDDEVPGLLDQLGWRRSVKRTLFFSLQMGVPLLAVALFCVQLLFVDGGGDGLLLSAFVGGVGFLVPKRLLVVAVKRRKERLAAEVSTLIPLLRMLFDVGMTVEQALRVLMSDGDQILPEFSKELRSVINRVDAGLELGPELREMAAMIDVDEVSDCISILEQLLRQGGGAMASLLSLKQLLDDRRLTAMQEKVSKLSAKMSAVMVGFLFPALLIVLAGPGFIAVFKALGDMNG